MLDYKYKFKREKMFFNNDLEEPLLSSSISFSSSSQVRIDNWINMRIGRQVYLYREERWDSVVCELA